MSTPARRLPTFVVAALAAGLVMLTGCTTTRPSTKATWNEASARGHTYSTILVVGVSPNLSQRCAFERILAKRLRNESTLVAASCDALKQKEPLTREAIEAAVDELGIDSVIATLLVARSFEAKDGGSRDTRGSAGYKATDAGWAYGWDGYYGAYGVPVIYADFVTAPSITTIKAKIEVSTKVYDTRSGKPVYTINTKMKNILTRDQAYLSITAAIAEQLQDDKLVREDKDD